MVDILVVHCKRITMPFKLQVEFLRLNFENKFYIQGT